MNIHVNTTILNLETQFCTVHVPIAGRKFHSVYTVATMKSAADPYEFFRWKSSCGRLVVRTTWVKGVRHVVLSDDDDDGCGSADDGRRRSAKENRQPRNQRESSSRDDADDDRKTTTTTTPSGTNRSPLSAVDANADENHESSSSWYSNYYNNNNYNHNGGGDENYVERVLHWLQKPSGMLETRQKPMSAPGNGVRRPALVKTCSIPENRSVDQQVVETDCKRPTRSTRNYSAKSHCQKTELHVHMPSMCPTANDNGKEVDKEY